MFEFWGEILVWRDPAIHPETWRVDPIEPPVKTPANTAPHLIEDLQCQLPLKACFAAADHLSYSHGIFFVETLKEMWLLHLKLVVKPTFWRSIFCANCLHCEVG